MSTKIWVVDAFTADGYMGNPAGVSVVDEYPDYEDMLFMSAKLGFSNSAFIKKIAHNKFQIRWFTPHSEAPICGHATIAASHVIINEGMASADEEIIFESLSGQISTRKVDDWYRLNFPSYNKISPIAFDDIIKSIVGDVDSIFLGLYEKGLFLELEEAKVRSLQPNLEELKKYDCRALTITSKSTAPEFDFISRYFAPKVGIDEDPVCASAHCALIPYWSAKLKKENLMAYQASKRGGVLKCQYLGNRVLISGKSRAVFSGDISAFDAFNKNKCA